MAACAVLSFVTLNRIDVYTDQGTYCRDVLRAYPSDHKAWNNLAVHYWEASPPAWTAAEHAFKKGLASRERYLKGTLNLARLYLDWDRSAPAVQLLEQAEQTLAPVRRSNPDALYLLGKVSLRRADREPSRSTELLEEAWGVGISVCVESAYSGLLGRCSRHRPSDWCFLRRMVAKPINPRRSSRRNRPLARSTCATFRSGPQSESFRRFCGSRSATPPGLSVPLWPGVLPFPQ